jgi:hypothetical protein
MKKKYSLINWPFSDISKIAFLMSILILCTHCKKFTLVDPPKNSITQDNVYEDDVTASAVMTGLYSRMQSGNQKVELSYISVICGLSADEFGLWDGAETMEIAYFKNELLASKDFSFGHELWNKLYEYIYTCNSVIAGSLNSKKLSSNIRMQLISEAKFIRGLLYFYLTNLYGDIPIITSIDPVVNRLIGRAPTNEVYSFIVADLKEAQNNLSNVFLTGGLTPYTGTPERVRPTKWAATALLARVYLYLHDYVGAEREASSLILNTKLFKLVDLHSAFLKNNLEAIWQLQGTAVGFNTIDSRIFNLNAEPIGFNPSKPVFLSKSLISSFEPGDGRLQFWTDKYIANLDTFYFANKYKVANYDPAITSAADMQEYLTVFRLGEQYLIRAEARTMAGDLTGATVDLNTLRQRARLVATPEIPDPLPEYQLGLSQQQLLNAILYERQIELFTEFGHRWLDLKRSGTINSVMAIESPKKGSTWQVFDQLYPLPYSDLQTNPNLTGHQNPGY